MTEPALVSVSCKRCGNHWLQKPGAKVLCGCDPEVGDLLSRLDRASRVLDAASKRKTSAGQLLYPSDLQDLARALRGES